MNDKLNHLVFAARTLALCSAEIRSELLRNFARIILEKEDYLLSENQKDLEAAKQNISGSMLARLKLNRDKLLHLSQGITSIANSPDPVDQIIEQTLLDDGLVLDKVRVPLGVVGVIFESRPDVLPQLVALAIRSGNALALKGGKESKHSNEALLSCLFQALENLPEIPTNFISLFHDREIVQEMIRSTEIFSLIIPRGSNEMVKSIMEQSLVPVLGHADGVCHVFVHKDANLSEAIEIVIDSKIQYSAACNSVETLLVDRAIAEEFLADFSKLALQKKIVLKGSREVVELLPDISLASDDDWHREYSDLILNVKIVSDLSEAVEHINYFGSHHTDTIVSKNSTVVEEFLSAVDSACVFANCSTRFSDGFRFGLGAEVGIGTGKIHARGPVGIEGLLTYKYKLRGSGQQVRSYVGESAKGFKHVRQVLG